MKTERLEVLPVGNIPLNHDFTEVTRTDLRRAELVILPLVVLLRLLGESMSGDSLSVRIGHENEVEGLTSTSVVTVGYARGDEVVAQMGVVGPTRMDYPSTMGSVRAVARYVGRILTEQQ